MLLTIDSLEKATEATNNGSLCLRKAAYTFKISHCTIRNNINDFYNKAVGRHSILSETCES